MGTLIKFKEKVESFLKENGFWAYSTSNMFGTTFHSWSFEGYKDEEMFEHNVDIYVVWDFQYPMKAKLELDITTSRGDIAVNNFVKGITNRNLRESRDYYYINPHDCDESSINMIFRIISNAIKGFENLNKSYIKD